MANNPLGLPALISPYPGGKSGGRYFRRVGPHVQSLICDRLHYYDVVVVPFAGSGATVWQHPHGATSAIAADIDPGVQAVWECWGNETLKALTLQSISDWKEEIAESPATSFRRLKAIADDGYSATDYHMAAAYLVTKRLVFGGVLRCNKQGGLNVALSADKLDKFLNSGRRHKRECNFTYSLFPSTHDDSDFWGWQYRWPDNGIKSLTFGCSWQDAVQVLTSSNHERALVVIDPPYWTPDKKMTEAYAHHGDPGSYEVMSLAVDCFDAVLATGKAERIVVFNYYSEVLDDALLQVQEKYNRFDSFVSNLGPLSTMNNGQGTEYHKYYSEAVWEIGGRRMFRDHDALQQLSFA